MTEVASRPAEPSETLALRPSTRPEPIYVLGDSHAMAFNLRLYAGDDGRRFLFQTLYTPGIVAAACAGKNGDLSPAIATALAGAGLLVDVAGHREPLHRTLDPHWRHLAVVEGRPRTDPAIVLSVGALDMGHFGAGLSDVEDFALPASLVEGTGVR